FFEARIVTLEENTFLTIIRDITQRKKAEMAVKKEKETTQTYLDIAEVIFVIIGTDQNIRMINKRGCEILEYKEDELIGKNWFDTIIKEEVRDEVKAGFVDVIEEKREVRRQTESFVVTKSGKELIMAWSNTVIRDKEGRPVATLSSGSDLTAIRNAEVEAELAVIRGQELERKRIAEELHDGVGSLLSAVKLNFDHLADHIRKDDELSIISDKLNDLLLNAMDEIRSISHNLKPSTIDTFGLVNTLEDLCKDISNTQSTLVNFQSFGLDKRLDYIQEIGLYRIAQELINNSVKHANARRIDVKLIEHQSYVLMMVEDDGIGFDSKQHSNGGMGLKNIDSRVRSLKGSYDIDALAGRGTLITVEIPKRPAYGKN
ncbi:MAG: PAS domain-containing sensor histidine kinase, partial [Cyclobacteriaceae bacterium]